MKNVCSSDINTITWRDILTAIHNHSGELTLSPAVVWEDGEEILVSDEITADVIADFLECLGFDTHTGYYDPEQDERDHATDDHTGWWYIDID